MGVTLKPQVIEAVDEVGATPSFIKYNYSSLLPIKGVDGRYNGAETVVFIREEGKAWTYKSGNSNLSIGSGLVKDIDDPTFQTAFKELLERNGWTQD